jgi:hypothetical protein
MEKQSRRLNQVIAPTIAIVFVVIFSTFAVAQRENAAAVFASAPRVQTSVKGVTAFAAPSKGFNPLTATNVQLLTYGLPQRPDKATNPKAYEHWERGMLALKTRANDVKPMPYSSHTMVPAGPPSAAGIDNTISVGSYNWSGIANTNKLKAWNNNTSFNQVESVFNVPVAKPPFGSVPCSDGPWLESTWNGIGGFTEGSLVQGGSALYWDAGGCKGKIIYNGWVEWYPSYPELEILCGKTPCPVTSGDDFWVISYGVAGTAEQFVFVEDLTQQWSGTFGMTWVSGPGLIGTSAEYIVERPCCTGSGNFYPLTNYIYDFFDYSYALDGKGTVFFAGSTAATTAVFTMYADDAATAISYPTAGTAGYQGRYSIWFADENCAYSGGCTP